jgi:hypothetical protein
MNKPGLPDTDTDPSPPVKIRRPRLVLLLGVVALILAVFIGSQVLGVLFGIVFPEKPPLPPNVREISHESTSYGVDSWFYGSDEDACAVLVYYQGQATKCTVAPFGCGSDMVLQTTRSGQHVALCSGEKDFSIFMMTWDVNIATGDELTGQTQFRLDRKVYWAGNKPRPTPEFSQ